MAAKAGMGLVFPLARRMPAEKEDEEQNTEFQHSFPLAKLPTI